MNRLKGKGNKLVICGVTHTEALSAHVGLRVISVSLLSFSVALVLLVIFIQHLPKKRLTRLAG